MQRFQQRDIRATEEYARADRYLRDLFAPDTGHVVNAADPAPRPGGSEIAFTGYLHSTGAARRVLCIADADAGTCRRLRDGDADESHAAWSPDGGTLAWLSDERSAGSPQLVLRDWAGGAETHAPVLAGGVEFLAWSPDGQKLLLGVAGAGADKPGVEGATTTHAGGDGLPDWVPEIEIGTEEHRWRRLWIWHRADGRAERLGDDATNIWEAAWCGNDRIVAIASDSPVEGSWYAAPLIELSLQDGSSRVLFRSELQLGCVTASPDGLQIAVIEAVCSDRRVVAGDLLLLDAGTGKLRRPDTLGVHVTGLAWRDDKALSIAGRRKFETVLAGLDTGSGICRQVWSSDQLGCGGWYPLAAPWGADRLVTVVDGFQHPPALAVIDAGGLRVVQSFAHEGSAALQQRIGRMQPYTWTAPDGLEIWGWLVLPTGPGPHPLIMQIHGGPVHHHGNRWLEHMYDLPSLVERGYALFYPNPRGSNGNGTAYARHVLGDMGGADTHDLLSGIDALVQGGIADPKRLGVTGRSYGGYMSSWLVTQDQRFAAALPQAPVANWYSQHRTSQIPQFDRLFLNDDPSRPGGRYFERSPVMFADMVTTPLLIVTGSLDRSTPPTQGLEFHRSVRGHGGCSTLLTYANEGHHIGSYAARADYLARTMMWFESHLTP